MGGPKQTAELDQISFIAKIQHRSIVAVGAGGAISTGGDINAGSQAGGFTLSALSSASGPGLASDSEQPLQTLALEEAVLLHKGTRIKPEAMGAKA
jgi:hypothetical protein